MSDQSTSGVPPEMRNRLPVVVVGLFLVALYIVLQQLNFKYLATALAIAIYLLLACLFAIGKMGARGGTKTEVAIIAFAVAWVVINFAQIYQQLSIDDPMAFGSAGRLSFGTAVYVALGNLTTAGTGEVVPHSEAARLAVSAQFIVNLVLIGLALPAVFRRPT